MGRLKSHGFHASLISHEFRQRPALLLAGAGRRRRCLQYDGRRHSCMYAYSMFVRIVDVASRTADRQSPAERLRRSTDSDDCAMCWYLPDDLE